MTPFADRELVVVDVKTSMITVEDVDGNQLTRDASKFKRKIFSGQASRRVDAGLGTNQARTEPVPVNALNNGEVFGEGHRGARSRQANPARPTVPNSAASSIPATSASYTVKQIERLYPVRA